jgi:adenylate kinase family enzyme
VPACGQRVIVLGTSASGKTTLAKRLATLLDAPHIEMDALHWEPNWTQATEAALRERVVAAIAGERWVVDGNYSMVRDLTWPRAETVIWLDYPLPLILLRLTRRTLRRVVLREELWNGNRERLWEQFTRDSLYWWVLTTYRRRRREIPAYLAEPAYAHLTLVHMRSPRAADAWLAAAAAALRR